MIRVLTSIVVAIVASSVNASPQVALDDPRYDQLSSMYARGIIAPYIGVRPLTEARMNELIGGAGQPPSSWWVRPLGRVLVRLIATRDLERPYSSSRRSRDLVGLIAMSCERTEGRPCGPGYGLYSELDSSVGYQDWLAVSTKLRAGIGSNAYAAGLSLDHVYLNAKLGPLATEVGRGVIVLGPSARTSLGWSQHAPPLDHARVSTDEPVVLSSSVRASFVYILGRLRDPQTFSGNVVSIGRGQLDLGDNVQVGAMQLLQLLGDGAGEPGVVDFFAEHVRRGDESASSSDSSNRRVGLDLSIRSPSFGGARFYYALMFEDWRDRLHHALRHDADHLVGVELAALGPHGLVVEIQQTGMRSQEHVPRVTGFTNAGRVVGSPLGPDARSFYAGGRIAVGSTTLSPWFELVRFSSDTYTFVVGGPINRATRGPSELRFRAGTRFRAPVGRELTIEVDAWFEHVERFAFEPGARRENVGAGLSAIWRPTFTLH